MAYKDLPGKFYTTGAAGSEDFAHYNEVEEAIEAAKREVASGRLEQSGHAINPKNVRYVVEVVAKIEPDRPPMKVTRY